MLFKTALVKTVQIQIGRVRIQEGLLLKMCKDHSLKCNSLKTSQVGKNILDNTI